MLLLILKIIMKDCNYKKEIYLSLKIFQPVIRMCKMEINSKYFWVSSKHGF